MDLSNDNVIHVKKGQVEYLQFRKLLEYKDIVTHAYTLGKNVNFRTAKANKEPLEKEIYKQNTQNYKDVCEKLGQNYINIVKCNQEHTKNVASVKEKVNKNEPDFNVEKYNSTDGLITNKKDIILATTNADCILMLFFDPQKKVIANVHSGWKGTLQEISIEAVKKMKKEYSCNAEDIMCFICPSIRKCHFEVDQEVKDLFYNKFKKLYNKSQELSYSKNVRQHGIGEYVENVFNRKAFLFANQAACNIYYEKAKSYFARNEIWVEYYITLVCQAGTDIVIQEFDEAIELCQTAVFEANQRDIKIPQIEKLYNNQIIAEFLLAEQDAKTPQKTISFAKKAIKELRDLLTGEKNATQFVIYTNICSLYLYSNNDKQYVTYKRKLEKLYECEDISNVADESIDDFYRYYFSWFELYRKINSCNWEDAWHYVNQLDDFVPALFRKQEIFWNEKNDAVKQLINNKETISAYNFCHNLVKTKRTEQVLSKFFCRGLMLSDLQYTSYS